MTVYGVSPLARASAEKMSAAHWPARCNRCIAERERRDDAARHGLTDAERIADGEHQVADLDLPLTLNHNDLHDNNVVVGGTDEPLRFFDLGDAVATEPLGALRIALDTLLRLAGLDQAKVVPG